jgi:phosphatidylglycerophosphatase A
MPKKLIEVLATGFYLGRLPKAPGTFGTLLGIPLAIGLFYLGAYGYMFATISVIVGSILIAHLHEQTLGTHDSSEIVIDEVAGFLVTMTWLPLTWQSFVVGFVLFRILDATKPFPINLIDEKIKGGLGVVADDIVAGVIANILLQVVYTQTDWLGVQLLQ